MAEWSPFQYYVFFSQKEEPTEDEVAGGIYLTERGSAVFLQAYFAALHDECGILIDVTENEVIHGDELLRALFEKLEEALIEVRQKPTGWRIPFGYEYDRSSRMVGEKTYIPVSRGTLIEFLEGAKRIIDRARESDGFVHFGGGH